MRSELPTERYRKVSPPRLSGEAALATTTATPGREILPGYRLLEPLGSGGFGEVWKCEAPGGLFKAVKLIRPEHDLDGGDAALTQELRALNHIKTIRHPYILSLDRIETVDGELVIVMELADKSLRDLLRECQAAGRPGIPRDALLGFLREAAEALDVLNLRHGIQHLDIKPDNLFLISDHVKVADFGLADTAQSEDCARAASDPAKGLTPLYAAPERFRGLITPSSDQYSLALVYQELLTGSLPFDGTNRHQLILQHASRDPDLSLLPAGDRPAVTRALSKEPARRFPSCTEFVRALTSGPAPGAEGEAPAAGGAEVRRAAEEALRETARGKATPTNLRPSGVVRAVCQHLPGYQFLDCLGQTPLGDSWKVQAPDGRLRLAQFVYGFADGGGHPEAEAVARLKYLRHPGLLRLEAAYAESARVILVTDLPEQSLWERYRQCRAEGLPGIPRPELLGLLRAAAEALDDLADDHDLSHLGLNPRNLVLGPRRLHVAEFGLVAMLWGPAGGPVGPLNARYAAPELFREPGGREADVYSLALMYQELLTGSHPLGRLAARRSAFTRGDASLDLDPLAAPERAVAARALDPDPQGRFPTCAELVDALETAAAGRDGRASKVVSAAAAPPGEAALPPPSSAAMEAALAALVAAARGQWQEREQDNVRYLLLPGEAVEHRCVTNLVPGFARLKLEGFAHEWGAELVRADGEESFLFQLHMAGGFWQRWFGSRTGLTVEVSLKRLRQSDFLTEVTVRVKPSGTDRKAGAQLLQEAAVPLLAGLRSFLQAGTELRSEDRLPCDLPLEVRPVLAESSPGAAIPGRARNVSPSGMGLFVGELPPTPRVYVRLTDYPDDSGVAALAEVKRAEPGEDGGYELGVEFLPDEPGEPQDAGGRGEA
jgi:serine/threonine protein kinase